MKNKDEFEKFVEDKKIKNVLIGNGFGLSHPKLKEAFKWNMYEAIGKNRFDIMAVKSSECPETDLGEIRRNIIRKVLEFYVANLFKVMGKEPSANLSELYKDYKKLDYNCVKFLQTFDKVFTLNYDPIMYFEILSKTSEFKDGFWGSELLCQDDVIERLEESNTKSKVQKRVYYMHGSWFIQYQENAESLCKIPFSQDYDVNINDLYNVEKKLKPFLIFEDRHNVKKDMCTSKSEVYFKHCYDQLKKAEGDLLVFGVSFNNDDHILEALNESKFSKIYITHIGCDVPKELNKKVREKLKKDFEFVSVEENVIWKNIMTEKK